MSDENKPLAFAILCIIFIGLYFYWISNKITLDRLKSRGSDPIEAYSYLFIKGDVKEERQKRRSYKRYRYFLDGKPYTGKVYSDYSSAKPYGYLEDGYKEGVWNNETYKNGYLEGKAAVSDGWDYDFFYIKGEIQDGTYTSQNGWSATYKNGKLVQAEKPSYQRSRSRKKSSNSINEYQLLTIIKGCCSGSGGTYSPSGQDCIVSNRNAFTSCVGSGKVRYSNGNEYDYSGNQFAR